MSKPSIERILSNVKERKEQEERERFTTYLSNLKVGDLIQIPGLSIISPVTFSLTAAGNECLLEGVSDTIHIVDDYTEDFWDIGEKFLLDKIYTGLILEKAQNTKCSCCFATPNYKQSNDLIVLINERSYYIRLHEPSTHYVFGI